MAKLHGRTGAIAISASTSPAGSPADEDFVAVGSLRAWSLSFDRTPLDSTSLRSTGRTYVPSLEDVTGSFEGVFETDDISDLVTASDDTDAVWVRITPSTDYPALFFQGAAWIRLTVGGAVHDAVTVSGALVGHGVWEKSL